MTATNNNVPSVGDVFTLVYDNCQDTAGETLNGSMTMTLTQVSVTPVPFGSAQVAVAQMSMATASHAMTLNGRCASMSRCRACR